MSTIVDIARRIEEARKDRLAAQEMLADAEATLQSAVKEFNELLDVPDHPGTPDHEDGANGSFPKGGLRTGEWTLNYLNLAPRPTAKSAARRYFGRADKATISRIHAAANRLVRLGRLQGHWDHGRWVRE